MNILAIDTSTEYLMVGLESDKGTISLSARMGLKHATTLLPWIERILKDASIKPDKLELIVCSIGPGSFTGLRIGLATVKGLVMGTGCSVVGIRSLDHFAFPYSFFDGAVVPVINAKKNRYYAAIYVGGKRESDYLDIGFEALSERLKGYDKILFTGPVAVKVGELFRGKELPSRVARINVAFHPESESLIRLGVQKYQETGGESVENLVPFYIRKSEAEIKKFGAEGNE